jgi:hypothetical protein
VVFTKEQFGKRFVIVDGAMTELLRPALVQGLSRRGPGPGTGSRRSPDTRGPGRPGV